MSERTNTAGGGISLLGLTGLAFVILKLCHVIDWSWWWVTAPFWGGIALAIVYFIIEIGVIVVKLSKEERNGTDTERTDR